MMKRMAPGWRHWRAGGFCHLTLLSVFLLPVFSCTQDVEIPPAPNPYTFKPPSQPAAPTPQKLSPEAQARKDAWLRSPLTGKDTKKARPKEVYLTTGYQYTYQVFFESEHKLLCGLSFGEDGRPAEINLVTWTYGAKSETACHGDGAFASVESKFALECEEVKDKEICRGKYTLEWPNGDTEPEELEIVRPLGVPLIGERPPSAQRPGGDMVCADLDCANKKEGFAACRPVGGKPNDLVLCKCQGGAGSNEGRCPTKTYCYDANDGGAFCKEP